MQILPTLNWTYKNNPVPEKSSTDNAMDASGKNLPEFRSEVKSLII